VFGAWDRTLHEPGPHYAPPSPIGSVDVVPVLDVRRQEIGFRTIGPGQIQDVPEEALMLTGDENIVDAQVIVQYRIIDPGQFLFVVVDADAMLKVATEAALRQVIGQGTVDDALTEGRGQIQESTRTKLQQILDSYGSGLLIQEVKLQAVRPPQPVEASFKDVVSALEDRSRLINEAEGYKEDILPKARGQAQQVLREAEAYREQRILRANGDAARFISILTEYEKAREVTRQRMYLETIEQVLPSVRKYVLDSNAGGSLLQFLPLDAGGTPFRSSPSG
jgi:membrane protease subunit HflK